MDKSFFTEMNVSMEEFLENLDQKISEWSRILLVGQNIEAVARRLGKSPSLLYQFTYGDRPQKPSFKQIVLIALSSPEKDRFLKDFCRFFGSVALRRGPAEKMLKELVGELEE